MACDLVDKAFWRRANTQDSDAASLNLCSASILNNLGRDAQRSSLAAQLHHLVLALNLYGNLGLAILFPAAEHAAFGGLGIAVSGEGLVAGERCV